MAAADRLSALPDGVLERILRFAPAREGAATAVLSRRWRLLWRRAGAINLDMRPYAPDHYHYRYNPAAFDSFFGHAGAALDAFRRSRRRRRPALKRLALVLKAGDYLGFNRYCNRDRDDRFPDKEAESLDDDRIEGFLADPATAGLEELRLETNDGYFHGRMYEPLLGSLQCAATLRVLELTCCYLEPPPAEGRLHFPRLADLRLRRCAVAEGYLQVVVDAAPALASLALVGVTHRHPSPKESDDYSSRRRSNTHLYLALSFSLRCPSLTAFLLDVTTRQHEELEDGLLLSSPSRGIELDMPSLRSFRYRGTAVGISMLSPAPRLARVDMDTTGYRSVQASRMFGGFHTTRVLKLRLFCIESTFTGVGDEDGQPQQDLPAFPNLELLDVEGLHEESYFTFRRTARPQTAAAIARLLVSCPVISELRLRTPGERDFGYSQNPGLDGKLALAKSIDRFKRFEYASMALAQSRFEEFREIEELPACDAATLSRLRKVTLHFKAKKLDCFPVQLAKFLVENAVGLEEMHIFDGNRTFREHLNLMVGRWRADSFQRRNLMDTGTFQVYMLDHDPAVSQSWDDDCC